MAIYFFHRVEENIVKIGFTNNIASRQRGLATLREWAAGKVAVIRFLEGKKPDEKRLHERFEAQKADPPEAEWYEWQSGKDEWFTFSEDMLTEDFGLAELPIPPRPPKPKRVRFKSSRYAHQHDFTGLDQRLRRFRLAVSGQKTLTTFCKDLGFTPQAWLNYEGRRGIINIHHASKLMQTYGVTLDWIYKGDTDDAPAWMLDLDPSLTFGELRQTYPDGALPGWTAEYRPESTVRSFLQWLDIHVPRAIRRAMNDIEAREADQGYTAPPEGRLLCSHS